MARAIGSKQQAKNCRHLGEFGIGINEKAQITVMKNGELIL